ncbi:hypothetical protein M422DRAFT_258658 [Sphaerobolus stellatus SS14]|uniref:DUF4100 domain-containing protein n=1 Tax=Sphaerobolus stellatus (strain SS14) TaxID=990650 RepID=A0A0C9VLR6_SPHS4|nr:hypothetical protein M422DRAFT_258658 [Sphaerobolus stellatus SS14]
MATTLMGRAAMPAPGSNRAPKTFDGSEDNIVEFLELFENCADDAQLPDKEKYTRNHSAVPIKTDTELRAYQRVFQAITHYLIKEKAITEDEQDHYYRFSLHENTRQMLEQQLTTTRPDHPRSKAYKWTDPRGGALDVLTRKVIFPTTPSDPPSSSNIDDLLLHIKSLTVRDQEYAATYAKIQAMNPMTADLLQKLFISANIMATSTVNTPCMFCKDPIHIHRTWQCPIAQEHLRLKKISLSSEGYWRWPNGDRISSHPQGIRLVIDQAEACISATPGTTTQAQVQSFVLTVDPIKSPIAITSSFIEEIPDDSANTFVAQTARKASLSVSAPTGSPTPSTSVQPSEKKAPQYQYQSKIEDTKAAQAIFDKMLDTSITITQRELLTVSSDLRKHFVDGCKINRIPVYSANIVPMESEQTATTLLTQSTTLHTASIRELDVKIQGKHAEIGIYDPGAELVCISDVAARELGLPFSTNMQLSMTDANGGSKATFGIIENLELVIGGMSIYVHAWIIKDAPYRLLLGRPFQLAARADTKDIGDMLVMQDLLRPAYRLHMPMRPYVARARTSGPSCNLLLMQMITGAALTATSLSMFAGTQTVPTPLVASSIKSSLIPELPTPALTSVKSPFADHYFREIYDFASAALGLKYKPVNRKVRPVPTTMPEEAVPKRRFPEDPEFLTEEELKLSFQILKNNEEALAWDDSEQGTFWEDYFEPVVIPTVEHEPWAQKGIPIPPGLQEQVIQFIKKKIASGVYEPSSSSYHSRWFCVPKKDGKFRIVHDLQPLNTVTIKDAGLPLNIEPYVEHCAG